MTGDRAMSYVSRGLLTGLGLLLGAGVPLVANAQVEPSPSSSTVLADPVVLPRVIPEQAAGSPTDRSHGPSYRWYVAPSLGWVRTDLDRNTDNPIQSGLAVGRWINPDMSLDLAYTLANAEFDPASGRGGKEWETSSLGVVGRWYGRDAQDATRPYVLAGVGGVRHAAVSGVVHTAGWSPMATVGVGVQHAFNDRVALRGEVALRHDRDAISSKYAPGLPRRDHYNDAVASVGLVVGLDHIEQPWVTYHQDLGNPPPVPSAPSCDQLDDDGDGVNNCDDRCLGSAAGVVVGPDGCPQKVVIDLRGVHFKFDRPRPGEHDVAPSLAEPSQESLDVLDQAVDLLNRYATLRVDIVGHTDAVGSDAYNQALSEIGRAHV